MEYEMKQLTHSPYLDAYKSYCCKLNNRNRCTTFMRICSDGGYLPVKQLLTEMEKLQI